METILQGLLELTGVSVTMVFDGSGQLVAHRGHAVYDRALCAQVAATLTKAVDSIQLQHQDWESITAQFADGKLLLRNIGAAGGRSYVLAIVADVTLNPSFATVAIRVASNKLKKEIEAGPAGTAGTSALSSSSLHAGSASGVHPAAISGPHAASGVHPAAASKPVLSSSAPSWSKASSVGLSQVTAADPASMTFLSRCAKELARHVGPMAKVYVEEAVRRISPDAPFTLSLRRPLAEELGGQIEDPKERAAFLKAVEKA